jgi:hypothetical protein
MAAKCWSDLTFYYDVRSDRERQLVNLKAIEFAEKVGARSFLHSDAFREGAAGACGGRQAQNRESSRKRVCGVRLHAALCP